MNEEVLSILKGLDTNCSGKVSEDIWTKIESVIQSSLLPEQTYGEDRPSVEADFNQFKDSVKVHLEFLKAVLTKLLNLKIAFELSHDTSFEEYEIKREVVVWALLLCGEHSVSNLWSTNESCNLANECVDTLCRLFSCPSIAHLLTGKTSKSPKYIFKVALTLLRPKLLKETWRHYPAAISAYRWMLTNVSSPHLSEYLNIVLPTALIIVDDYVVQRRLIGLSCVCHIINNVARTELCQHGLHNVIYKALENILLQNDVELMELTLACITKLLQMTERGYTRSAEAGMWDRFDDTLQVVLQNMSLEDRIAMRKCYINSLGPLISAMGPPVIRWTKPLLAVLDEYLHKESFDTRASALKVLLIYQELSLPRLFRSGNQVLFLLLRTLHDISSDDKNISKLQLTRMLKTIEECLSVLKTAAPCEINSIKDEIVSIECNSIMRDLLNKVFLLD